MIVKREATPNGGELILIEADTVAEVEDEYFDLSEELAGKMITATLPYRTASGKYAILAKVRG